MERQKEQIPFYVFMKLKLSDGLIKIHADLIDVYGESCV